MWGAGYGVTENIYIMGYKNLGNDYYQLYTEQIRYAYLNDKLSIKLPLSNLTRTSKTFNKML